MALPAVRIIKNFKLPKESGFYHRLVCMTGKNKGLSYFFSGKRVVLGRSDQADIQVLDTKSSREHAELAIVGGKYILSDLGSQNGIVVNDLKVSQHTLIDNDKIIIGSTVFKYNYVEVEEKAIVEVEDDEDDEDEDDEFEEEPKKKKSKKKDDEAAKKKRIYIIVAVFLAIFLLWEDTPQKPRKGSNVGKEGNKGASVNFRKGKGSNLDKSVREKLKSIIHRGRRELREQNFFRAIEQFNLALIMDPGNGEASFLLKKSQQRLDEFIQRIAKKAANETDQKRYRGAILQWCEIIRYLRDYPEDKRYSDAQKQVAFLAEKLEYEKDEYKCF